MKILIIILAILTLSSVQSQNTKNLTWEEVLNGSYSDNCETHGVILGNPPICPQYNYVLHFEDDFNQNSLNYDKWVLPTQGVTSDFDFNTSRQWYVNSGPNPPVPISNNILVNNGVVSLIAKYHSPSIYGIYLDDDWTTLTSNSFEYSSAMIQSKKYFGYGRYEIRCKIPKGKGFWPAFWTFSQTGWNELDVFEFWNESDCSDDYRPERLSKNPHFTVHSNWYSGGGELNSCTEDLWPCNGSWNSAIDYSLDYHVYTLDWDYYYIRWYIDGVLKREIRRYSDINGANIPCTSNFIIGAVYQFLDAWPNDNVGQQIIFNLAISNGNGSPDANTSFPASYDVDYVRYYKRTNCNQNLVFTSNTNLGLSNNIYNSQVGNNITCNGTIDVIDQLDLTASNSITLLPGFTCDNTKLLNLNINPSICSSPSFFQINDDLISINDKNDNELNVNNKLLINSENGQIKIGSNEDDDINYNILIYDISGKLLHSSKNVSFSNQIELKNIESGIYYVIATNTKTNEIIRDKLYLK